MHQDNPFAPRGLDPVPTPLCPDFAAARRVDSGRLVGVGRPPGLRGPVVGPAASGGSVDGERLRIVVVDRPESPGLVPRPVRRLRRGLPGARSGPFPLRPGPEKGRRSRSPQGRGPRSSRRRPQGRTHRGSRRRSEPHRQTVAAPLGDRRLGPDRRVLALPVDLLHGLGDQALHGAEGQRSRAGGPRREARERDQGPQVPGGLRRLPGQRLVPGQARQDRRGQPPQRPGRGQGGHERHPGGSGHHDGGEDQLSCHHRHPRPDDRPGRHHRRHDRQLPGDRQRRRRPTQARQGGRGDLDRIVHHAGRRLAVGAGHLLLRVLPQSDRPDGDGKRQGRRPDDHRAALGGQAEPRCDPCPP